MRKWLSLLLLAGLLAPLPAAAEDSGSGDKPPAEEAESTGKPPPTTGTGTTGKPAGEEPDCE